MRHCPPRCRFRYSTSTISSQSQILSTTISTASNSPTSHHSSTRQDAIHHCGCHHGQLILKGDQGTESRCQGILFIVDWLLCIAFYAVQLVAQHRIPTIRRLDPGSTYQRRIVAHMLIVTTVQFCNPVVLLILVITNDRLLHRKSVTPVTS